MTTSPIDMRQRRQSGIHTRRIAHALGAPIFRFRIDPIGPADTVFHLSSCVHKHPGNVSAGLIIRPDRFRLLLDAHLWRPTRDCPTPVAIPFATACRASATWTRRR